MINPMETILTIIATALVLVIIFFLARRGAPNQGDQSLLLIQNQINDLTRTIDNKMTESGRLIQSQFGESLKIVREVTERLTKLDETNRQVIGFTEQLRNLEDILKNPKQRGILGEYYLETLLKNVFAPGQYQMQYAFKDGTIVDAVIFLKDQVIPIDSKFSLENYNRLREEKDPTERERLEKIFIQDLKNRIEETAKYVRPEEGTLDFAFMFIPAEGIFYDLLINQIGAVKMNTRDLIDYAFIEKKVHIVSPTTFLAHLKMVLQGLKALQIEDSAKEIRTRVQELGRHLMSYEIYMKKLGTHLGTSVSMYNQAYKELGKIDKDVLRIGGLAPGIEIQQLPKPEEE